MSMWLHFKIEDFFILFFKPFLAEKVGGPLNSDPAHTIVSHQHKTFLTSFPLLFCSSSCILFSSLEFYSFFLIHALFGIHERYLRIQFRFFLHVQWRPRSFFKEWHEQVQIAKCIKYRSKEVFLYCSAVLATCSILHLIGIVKVYIVY